MPAFPDLPIILPDNLSNLYAPPFLGSTSTVAQVVEKLRKAGEQPFTMGRIAKGSGQVLWK